ncbi:MAG: SIR2 family NAD-dependent protein deacylase [Chloroflexota bacterium]
MATGEPLAERVDRAAELMDAARFFCAFTGAGISTESGVSDFRSPGGVWERYRIVTYQEFLSSEEARVEYWKMKRDLFNELRTAAPNLAHRALADLERMSKLRCLITQNIDGLHQEAGSSEVIELHGTNRKGVCLSCARTWPIEEIQVRLEAGDLDPRCEQCGGFIKPATVSFGQTMPEREVTKAFECAARSDLLLMVGSSLQVEPAASIPREAHRAGARLVFVNRTETPYDDLATVVFRERAGEVLPLIVERLGHMAAPAG